MGDWIVRFFKGALIGTGFILPGVSGGALAAVFGLYERIIGFIAHITKNFLGNVLFFIPVGLGALFGMFLVSRPLGFLLEYYETPVLWGFVGCIGGTFPALWKEAGAQGRSLRHYLILAVTAVLGFCFLYGAEKYLGAALPLNPFTWLFAGVIIALGVLVPGMSPSNFLVYLGMYTPMVNAFKTLEPQTLIPLFAGFALCVFSLSSLMDALFRRAYAALFHFVVGIVAASTLMIIPFGAAYTGRVIIASAIAFIAGGALGFWMSGLEKKYKT
ncbi:MAG: DUF368 domain-containing protein [Spirochaetaceae bacterium]|jgi:putative membrane protein|nr:DUF368 domain-containing protein [Spirochaetaceae bacterium]